MLRAAMGPPLPSFSFVELQIASLDKALSQQGLHGLLGQRALLRPQDASGASPLTTERRALADAEGRLLEVGVSAKGASSATFGPQGEGAIQGVFSDYITAGVHAHGGFPYSQWQGCSAD